MQPKVLVAVSKDSPATAVPLQSLSSSDSEPDGHDQSSKSKKDKQHKATAHEPCDEKQHKNKHKKSTSDKKKNKNKKHQHGNGTAADEHAIELTDHKPKKKKKKKHNKDNKDNKDKKNKKNKKKLLDGTNASGAESDNDSPSNKLPTNGTANGRQQRGRKRKRAGNDDDDDDDAFDDDYEPPCAKRFMAPQPTAEFLKAANPLPGFIDCMSMEEIIEPAISPFGHVMGYDEADSCALLSRLRRVLTHTRCFACRR